MSLMQTFNSKLSYKLHLPIIGFIIIGLVIVTTNAILSVKSLTLEKHKEVRETYQNYAQKALETQYQIVLTNVIALANNQELQKSLANHDRDAAEAALAELTQQYARYTDFKKVKIHIHTLSMTSFLRSWRPTQFGDDLSNFRFSLHHLKTTETPFATVELGRAGILIRGLAPIRYQDKIIGSIEFIQSFDPLVQELKEKHRLDALILSDHNQTIHYFNQLVPVGKNRVLLNNSPQINQALIGALKDYSFDDRLKDNHLILDNFYITGIPLFDFNHHQVGCLVIADKLQHVNEIIKHATESLVYQIIVMLCVDLIIIIFLAWILKRSITNPISDLSEKIQHMDEVIDNLDQLKQIPLDKNREDEIGCISKTFNHFVSHISHLFTELQKSNKITEEYLKAVYAGSIVSKANPKGIITYVNQALCDTTGYQPEELIGKPHKIFRHPSTPKSTFRDMWKTIQQGHIWHGLFKNCRKDGSTFYANITVVPIVDKDGLIIEYLALRDDVTELVESQKKLLQSFNTDIMTGLGNRFKLSDDYVELKEAYLAIIDIRSFKEINDFYGYDIGDKLLIEFGNRLFDYFDHPACRVYRLQGDEFAVLANGDLMDKEFFTSKVKLLAESIEAAPIVVDDYHPSIDLTMGLSTERAELFTEADIAHKTAKKLNKTLVIYTNNLKTSAEYKNNLLWTGRVKKAILNNQILSFYQPIVNNTTQTIEKYESLVRMVSENGNEIFSPFHFLAISKKARLYTKLTKIMIQNSFEYFSTRTEQFSINVSAEDMVNDEVINLLVEMFTTYPIANRLVLEIVESESIQNFEEVNKFIKIAKEYGCMIAIDDFGTGYSNFEFLLKLKPDFLKIDGSMIKNIHRDSGTYNVVETIVSFAKKNNIKTIAEFVSDKEIFETVTKLGIDYSQGYYFGEPRPAAI